MEKKNRVRNIVGTLSILLVFLVVGVIATVISDTDSTFTGFVNISDGLTVTSGRGSQSENIVRLIPSNTTTGYVQIAFHPENDLTKVEGDVLINVHNENLSGSVHQHLSIYSTSTIGGLRNRINIPYNQDYPDITFNEANLLMAEGNITINNGGKLFLQGGLSDSSYIDFNANRGEIRYNGNSEDMEINAGTGSNKDIVFNTGGEQVGKFNHFAGFQLGNGSYQANITLTSPDGTEFDCGVNNAGSFTCS